MNVRYTAANLVLFYFAMFHLFLYVTEKRWYAGVWGKIFAILFHNNSAFFAYLGSNSCFKKPL